MGWPCRACGEVRDEGVSVGLGDFDLSRRQELVDVGAGHVDLGGVGRWVWDEPFFGNERMDGLAFGGRGLLPFGCCFCRGGRHDGCSVAVYIRCPSLLVVV